MFFVVVLTLVPKEEVEKADEAASQGKKETEEGEGTEEQYQPKDDDVD